MNNTNSYISKAIENRRASAGVVLLAVLLVLFAAQVAAGAGETDGHGHAAEAAGHEGHDHAGHGHDEPGRVDEGHEGHDHAGHGHGDPDKPLAERMKEPCEHEVPIIACDKCRFEVGAVKLSSTTQALVTFETITTSPAPRTIDLVGELMLDDNHKRVVTSRIPGRLASISATVGTTMKEGDVVAHVESTELAQSALEYLKRLSELDFAEKKRARAALLFEKKVGSEQEVQEAQSARDLADLEATNARDRLKLFGLSDADVGRIRKNRSDTLAQGRIVLKAPIEGQVIQREGIAGEIISGDRNLLTIANICHLIAIGQLHEKQVGEVLTTLARAAIPVEVTVESFPGKTFAGQLLAVDTQMLEDTRTLPVRIEIRNPDSLLRPGMFVKIRLFLETAENQTLLPTKAVMDDEGSRFVFKQIEPNLFLRQPVVVGRRIGDRSVIQSGVAAGDVIVVDGAFLLKSDVLREKMGAGCAD
ncbi:MAG TPA: efflux RND transporter periplasmic adaptor subunit [Candidatus Ozemobacteraceae bacterium]|nr:efflux RND transporter periplasmic adaptor subunit [Candidatus Ozemobacteraceae bacterium]